MRLPLGDIVLCERLTLSIVVAIAVSLAKRAPTSQQSQRCCMVLNPHPHVCAACAPSCRRPRAVEARDCSLRGRGSGAALAQPGLAHIATHKVGGRMTCCAGRMRAYLFDVLSLWLTHDLLQPPTRAMQVRWQPGSIFSRRGAPVGAADILPSLLRVQPYTNAEMARKWGLDSYFPPAGSGLAVSDTLEEQQAICHTLLQQLGRRLLSPEAVPVPDQAFLVCPVRQEQQVIIAAAPMRRRQAAWVAHEQAVLITHHFECMLVRPELRGNLGKSGSTQGYVRVQLAGKRRAAAGSSKLTQPVLEWAHRLVCWLANGPPPARHGRWARWRTYQAAHLCGQASCLCPSHLRWLTPASNRRCARWHKQRRASGPGPHLWRGPW